ncbi:hypothetical protein [Saccharothrix australiensis]|uniref:hypothetical protein n=1 Tax=Saccharothrix australiensis TaxID=2072 RepID=UPI0011C3931A|nr:hypothetical protein [Saccharothrix australiensis]
MVDAGQRRIWLDHDLPGERLEPVHCGIVGEKTALGIRLPKPHRAIEARPAQEIVLLRPVGRHDMLFGRSDDSPAAEAARSQYVA